MSFWNRQIHLIILAAMLLPSALLSAAGLPMSKTFVGISEYELLIKEAKSKGWDRLPIGERTAKIGRTLVGTPYVNYTLEIDDSIEAASVNMRGMDCWTFFEIALASARVLRDPSGDTSPARMLKYIELDRYRGGKCTGSYLSRLHHLEDWLQDNEKRGLVEDMTRKLGGVRMVGHSMNYMGKSWKNFRYLRNNPSLVPGIRKIEAQISARPTYHIPKSRVARIESQIQSGDIICITTTWPGAFTSHVGLAYRDGAGVLRFLHASRDARKVIVDSKLSEYLYRYGKHAGIMVARPREL